MNNHNNNDLEVYIFKIVEEKFIRIQVFINV